MEFEKIERDEQRTEHIPLWEDFAAALFFAAAACVCLN
jgi:hypothetical protein